MSQAVFTGSLEVRWRWEEHGKKHFLSNCFSHYVVKQPITSWNILFIFIYTIDSIYDCFSIYNIKGAILKDGVLTPVLLIDSSCCLMFYLLGLLEPAISFVLVKCKHMTFPGLVGEPPQMEIAIVKEKEKVHIWWPLTASIWQPHSLPSRGAGNMIGQNHT